MKCTMFWTGGSSYAVFDTHNPEDAEEFDSLERAKRAFANRAHDRYYPCVDETPPEDGGPEAWVFIGPKESAIGQEYPDLILSFGPRGGVRVDRA